MGTQRKEKEIKGIFIIVTALFLVFLMIPILRLLLKSFEGQARGVSLGNYVEVLTSHGFMSAFGHSLIISSASAIITTLLAFLLAYTINYTNIPKAYKGFIRKAAVVPMLLPTITYGFAIIYSFGKQGLITQLVGRQLFEIYGFNGLLLGYVIYTLPISFLLVSNTMEYIDKKFTIVSRIMGDKPLTTFMATVVRPLLGTLAASFVQCFFLCFTDYGIPASVGGEYDVVATVLYNEMLGSIPNFNTGSAVAMMMLISSVLTIALLHYLEKYNIRYNKISNIEIRKNTLRDVIFGGASGLVLLAVLSVFLVIFAVPLVENWPYQMNFTWEHVQAVFADRSLISVYENSLLVAVLTALLGSLLTYGAALTTARSKLPGKVKQVIENISLITNTIPGMVIGIAYMLIFSGTPLQNTLAIIIICNVIHFFSTPYLMIKNSLAKMNASWETTAMLMGDTWLKTIVRVVTPNAMGTILEVFSYYFVNAMVTVSAVIFIAGARTMVITTKIKELQYYTKFNEIFVLSLLILFTNLAAKLIFGYFATDRSKVKEEKRKKFLAAAVAMTMAISAVLTGCGGSASDEVVLYTNADDEAIEAMKSTLDENGYSGQYIIQSFGTSELGGKLLVEGTNIEADLVTMSSFYLDSAQEQQNMFKDLTFETGAMDEYPSFYTPITAQEGAILLNTEMMQENNLPTPTSIKDLADPVYSGFISVTDIASSSTAWLLLQALVDNYGEDEATQILADIYKNAGPHVESSGSAPLKKVRAGEVAIGFGLRHQAVADKAHGLPVDYVDPTEGNYSLTESIAVVDKGDESKDLAMEMAECIITKGRAKLQEYYPLPIYEGETADSAYMSANPKVFPEKLTVDLLEQHQQISENAKALAEE